VWVCVYEGVYCFFFKSKFSLVNNCLYVYILIAIKYRFIAYFLYVYLEKEREKLKDNIEIENRAYVFDF